MCVIFQYHWQSVMALALPLSVLCIFFIAFHWVHCITIYLHIVGGSPLLFQCAVSVPTWLCSCANYYLKLFGNDVFCGTLTFKKWTALFCLVSVIHIGFVSEFGEPLQPFQTSLSSCLLLAFWNSHESAVAPHCNIHWALLFWIVLLRRLLVDLVWSAPAYLWLLSSQVFWL